MKKSNRYPPELRQRAVRLVDEGRREHSSLWAAIQSVASKIGCTPETLRRWYHQHDVDQGNRPGTPTSDTERLKQLERKLK